MAMAAWVAILFLIALLCFIVFVLPMIRAYGRKRSRMDGVPFSAKTKAEKRRLLWDLLVGLPALLFVLLLVVLALVGIEID
jgi:ABC-type Fe3+ transport system permease subunit